MDDRRGGRIQRQPGPIPTEERSVDFYGESIAAMRVNLAGREEVFVPIRPICDYLGLAWSAQRLRILRDPALSEAVQGVIVTITPSRYGGRGAGPQTMLCLPADYLHGWLFGVNAGRVKPELREKLIRYQKECYRALARAFQREPEPNLPPVVYDPALVWSLSRFLTDIAHWQLDLERRIRKLEGERGKPGEG